MYLRQACVFLLLSSAIALALTACPAMAQEGADTAIQIERRLLVSFSFGITSSGPAGAIERGMIASQFDETDPVRLFGGPTAHPFSRIELLPWVIALRYAMSSLMELGLTIGNAPIGTTFGYSDPGLSLSINSSVFTISPTASLRFLDILHLGIGPAVFVTTSRQGGGLEDISQSSTKMGFLLDAGLAVPARSRFFFTASLQYRYVGMVTIGPYVSRTFSGAKTMPSSSASYDHILMAVGMGLRL